MWAVSSGFRGSVVQGGPLLFVPFPSSLLRLCDVIQLAPPFQAKAVVVPRLPWSRLLCVCVCVCDTPAAPSAQSRQTADDEPLGDI